MFNGMGMWMRQPPQSETKVINPMNEVGIPTISAGIMFVIVTIYAFMTLEMARAFNLWLPSLVLALGVTIAEAVMFYKWEFSQGVLRQISGWLRKPVWVIVCGIFLVTFLVVGIVAFFALDWSIASASFLQKAEICLGIGAAVGLAPLYYFLLNNTIDPWFPATKFWITQPEEQQSKRLLVWPGTSVKEDLRDGQ